MTTEIQALADEVMLLGEACHCERCRGSVEEAAAIIERH